MNRNRGFTLVETLVALLVLSIGLLGVAALQFTSMQNNSRAMFRSQATYFAYDIADRMRANHDRAVDNKYNVDYGQDITDKSTTANADINAWKTALKATLPGGDGDIKTNGTDGEVVIRIHWDDSKGEAGASLLEFATRTRI